MNIVTTIRTTYRAEIPLKATPPAYDGTSGLYYRADCDENAANEARRLVEPAIAAIRARMKQPDGPVAWTVEKRGEGLVAVVDASVTKTS